MSHYIVPDEMTMQRMPHDAKVRLRERLLGSLRALHVPSAVIEPSDRMHFVGALDPAQIVTDARTLLVAMPSESSDVIERRRAALLDATSRRCA